VGRLLHSDRMVARHGEVGTQPGPLRLDRGAGTIMPVEQHWRLRRPTRARYDDAASAKVAGAFRRRPHRRRCRLRGRRLFPDYLDAQPRPAAAPTCASCDLPGELESERPAHPPRCSRVRLGACSGWSEHCYLRLLLCRCRHGDLSWGARHGRWPCARARRLARLCCRLGHRLFVPSSGEELARGRN